MNPIKHLLLRICGALLHDVSSKVIFYHDVFDGKRYTSMGTHMALFMEHLNCIREAGFSIVTDITQPSHEVKICFDDGFQGIYACKHLWNGLDWRPTIFLAVELVGKEGYLDKNQILELATDGFVFQSHGWSHRVLTDFREKELEHETVDAREWLEEMLAHEVSEICFPVGLFSPRVMTACRNAGYRHMYSSIPGNYHEPVFPNVLRRNLVQSYNVQELKAVLNGGLRPFASRYFKRHYLA